MCLVDIEVVTKKVKKCCCEVWFEGVEVLTFASRLDGTGLAKRGLEIFSNLFSLVIASIKN